MSKQQGSILIIDDDRDVLYTVKMILKQHYTSVRTETTPEQLGGLLAQEQFDVILLDMNYSAGITSGQEGLHWLKTILATDPAAHVVMHTAYGDIDLAVTAMKEGAIDFLVKPWEQEKLLATIQNIFNLSQARKEVSRLRSREAMLQNDLQRPFQDIVSVSDAMQPVFDTIEKVAKTDANVLVLGENGTGKELVAHAVHNHSPRKGEAFIKVDLGAVPETLFESELFGHKKGAFTDAKEDRIGRFEAATEGTLFLDEIGNLPLPLQAKLLTVLQSRQIVRVGTNKPLPVNIRLISATNMNLLHMVDHGGQFRQDLLYRLNTVEINLPPLRKRPEDIPVLLNHFLERYGRKYQKEGLRISASTARALQQYEWPGNIRELQHAVERAIILCDSQELEPEDFVRSPQPLPQSAPPQPEAPTSVRVEDVERDTIRQAIDMHEGNLTAASKALGMGRSTLYRKMKKYGL